MPKIEKHAAGTFCWVELATTDQSSAKKFYSSLFGWNAEDAPIGPNEVYTMFKVMGSAAAAAYSMPPDERATMPPHWNLYIAVDSADTSAKRAGELGGKVLVQPFDVGTFGRMAVIEDPTGVAFCIWQANDNPGMNVTHEDGAFCWADLSSPDGHRAKVFYEGLFGWKIGPDPKYPPDYLVIHQGTQAVAGITPPSMRNPEAPPHWMLFFMSEDVDGAAAAAKKLGGAVYLEPMSAGGARMAVLADGQGAAFSILQPPK